MIRIKTGPIAPYLQYWPNMKYHPTRLSFIAWYAAITQIMAAAIHIIHAPRV